jgi:hypothetical protein
MSKMSGVFLMDIKQGATMTVSDFSLLTQVINVKQLSL